MRIALILLLLAIVVLLVPIWLVSPTASAPSEALQAPSAAHWFGTDQFGRDLFSRVFSGARISWSIGIIAVLVSLFIGGLWGSCAALFGGATENVLMRFVEVVLAFPGALLAIVLATSIGPGLATVVVVLSVVYTGPVARFIHGRVKEQLHLEYIEAATALGSSRVRLLIVHMLPNLALPVLVYMTTVFAEVILVEAGLSYIGAGVRPPDPAWGTIINEGQNLVLAGAWWVSFFPGIAIALTVLMLNLFADSVVDEFRIGGHNG